MAHTIKGLAGTLGATHLRSIAITIEDALRRHVPDTSLESVIADAELLGGEFHCLAGSIQSLLQEMTSGADSVADPILSTTPASFEVFAELERLVATDSISTEAFLHKNELLVRPLLGELFDQLAVQVNDYAFEEAAATLKTAQHNLKLPSGGNIN
jgi:two-component system sensor histidine kinase/response regulator